jgi:hypothetical protein
MDRSFLYFLTALKGLNSCFGHIPQQFKYIVPVLH